MLKQSILMKRYLTIGLLAVLLTLAAGYVLELHHERDEVRSVARYDRAQARVWRNQDSLSRLRIQTLEASSQTVEQFYGDWVDSLTVQLDVQAKYMESAFSIGSIMERTHRLVVHDTTVIRDTVAVPAQTFGLHDRWSSLEGTIIDMELGLHQQYYDSISVVNSLRRDPGFRGWALGRRTLHTDAINHNPYARFTGVRTWKKVVRPLRFGVGPYVGYDFRQGVSFGISFHYSLIQF